ncbi:MAG: DUF2341 domain-containing protein, partial [DPANN group archaeon]|nr:DUF2341 domain-containing protein [DPANN group archaeon]
MESGIVSSSKIVSDIVSYSLDFKPKDNSDNTQIYKVSGNEKTNTQTSKVIKFSFILFIISLMFVSFINLNPTENQEATSKNIDTSRLIDSASIKNTDNFPEKINIKVGDSKSYATFDEVQSKTINIKKTPTLVTTPNLKQKIEKTTNLKINDFIWVETDNFVPESTGGKIILSSIGQKTFKCDGTIDNPDCFEIDSCATSQKPCYKYDSGKTIIYVNHFSGAFNTLTWTTDADWNEGTRVNISSESNSFGLCWDGGLYCNWNYRKAINVSSTSALTDYQINISVIWDSDMQDNFEDLRFTYYNITNATEIELPYWIELNYSQDNATVWIKTNKTSGDNTVYMYYGNATATSESNGSDVFVFFDDFDDGDISDWAKTTYYLTVGSSFSADTSYYNSPDYSHKIYNKGDCYNYPYSGGETRMSKTITFEGGEYIMGFIERIGTSQWGYCGHGTGYGSFSMVYINDVNYYSRKCNTDCTYVICDSTKDSFNFTSVSGTQKISISNRPVDCSYGYSWFDDLYIHKYIQNIPVISFGAEQTLYTGQYTSNLITSQYAITRIKPIWNSTEQDANKNITVEISADNGTTWLIATNNTNHTTGGSIGAGNELIFRISISTNDSKISPKFHDITLEYDTDSCVPLTDWQINDTISCMDIQSFQKVNLNLGSSASITFTNVSFNIERLVVEQGATLKIENSKNTVIQNGNLTVAGTLWINSTTYKINGTSDGNIGINLTSTGSLYIINNSNITNGADVIGGNETAHFFFIVNAGSNFSMNDSYLSKVGYDGSENHKGLFIETDNIYITNSTIKDSYIGLYLNYSNNNIILNSTITTSGQNAYGIYLHSSSNNNITGGSILSSSSYNYYLRDSNTNNNFTNTNFTAPRKIYFYDTTTSFNYNNQTDGNIQLKTTVSQQGEIQRSLETWSQSNMQWNDTNNTAGIISTYNLTGLIPNFKYTITNTSNSQTTTQYLTADSDGILPSFSISLNGNTQIKAITYDIDSCKTLDLAGATYTLITDIIDSFSDLCMNISANDVTLDCQGHTIDAVGVAGDIGIGVIRSSSTDTNVTIKNCIITDWNNMAFGIQLKNANNNTVKNITANSNWRAIYLNEYSSYNHFSNISLNSNSIGFYLAINTGYNQITDITSELSSSWGIMLDGSDNNNITDAVINASGEYGIRISSADNNTISNMIISNSGTNGIDVVGSQNTFYNNIFNNTNNVGSAGTNTNWNTTKQLGTNIVGKTYIGGNYWGTPDTTGISDTCWDTTEDYICESSYTIVSGNIDYLPLTTKSDSTDPNIYFVNPTENNNSYINKNYTYINWTLNDTNPDITILNWAGENETISQDYSNQTNLVDGIYTYYVWANDTAGNSNKTEIRTVTIDTTYPQFSTHITTPSTPNENESVQLNVTITEINKDTIWLQFDNNSGSTNYTITTTAGNEFYYTIQIGNYTAHDQINYSWWSNDSAGNLNSSAIQTFTVANQIPTVNAPTLNSTTPKTNDTLNCTGGTFGDLDAEDSEQSRQYKWYDTNIEIAGEISQTLDLTLTGLNKGDTIICSLRVSDGYDNSTWVNSSNTATIQNSIPQITLTSPADSDYKRQTFNFTYTVTDTDEIADVNYCELWKNVDNTGWTLHNNNTSPQPTNNVSYTIATLPTEQVETIDWYVNCTDLSSAENQSTQLTVYVDNVNPVSHFYTPEADNTTVIPRFETYLNLDVRAENDHLKYVYLSIKNSTGTLMHDNDSGLLADTPVLEWYNMTYNINISSWNTGNFTVYVNATDYPLNTMDGTAIFRINNVPTLTSIASNISLVQLGDSIQITTTGATDIDTVDTYLLGCGETPNNWNLCIGSAGTGERTCDFTSPWSDNTEHTIYCNMTDSHDNSTGYTTTITADNIDPFVTIYTPENTSYNTVSLDLNYTATDTNLDTSWYQYDGANTTLPGNITFTALDNQQSTLILWANDTVGNINSTSITFTVDTTPPTITIQSPENITYPIATLWFNVTTTDILSDVNWCGYSLDNAPNVTLSNATQTDFYNVNSTMTDAIHNVIFYCNDSLGNLNSTTITFTVDTTLPILTFTSPTENNNSYINKNYTYINWTLNDTNPDITILNWAGENETISQD